MEEICIEKRRTYKLVAGMVIVGLVVGSYFFIEATQKYVMPIAMRICLIDAKEVANRVINSSVDKVLAETEINCNDIFRVTNENDITMISTDTAIINTLCSDISDYVTESLSTMENSKVEVPYGATTGVGVLANIGPPIVFEIKPVGNAEVDYDTEFNSAGINQTNYKIWLTVNITVSLVNPIYDKEMLMTRKLMLVDTVINGKVPNYYYRAVE